MGGSDIQFHFRTSQMLHILRIVQERVKTRHFSVRTETVRLAKDTVTQIKRNQANLVNLHTLHIHLHRCKHTVGKFVDLTCKQQNI